MPVGKRRNPAVNQGKPQRSNSQAKANDELLLVRLENGCAGRSLSLSFRMESSTDGSPNPTPCGIR